MSVGNLEVVHVPQGYITGFHHFEGGIRFYIFTQVKDFGRLKRDCFSPALNRCPQPYELMARDFTNAEVSLHAYNVITVVIL